MCERGWSVGGAADAVRADPAWFRAGEPQRRGLTRSPVLQEVYLVYLVWGSRLHALPGLLSKSRGCPPEREKQAKSYCARPSIGTPLTLPLAGEGLESGE